MGIRSEGLGDILMFMLAVLLGELGEYLDKYPMGDYSCPEYCEVDHKHLPISENKQERNVKDGTRYDNESHEE